MYYHIPESQRLTRNILIDQCICRKYSDSITWELWYWKLSIFISFHRIAICCWKLTDLINWLADWLRMIEICWLHVNFSRYVSRLYIISQHYVFLFEQRIHKKSSVLYLYTGHLTSFSFKKQLETLVLGSRFLGYFWICDRSSLLGMNRFKLSKTCPWRSRDEPYLYFQQLVTHKIAICGNLSRFLYR